jgi:serine-type D-Ala-D-Ala carboxypeptidase (penicillin-binding protein 5/6)
MTVQRTFADGRHRRGFGGASVLHALLYVVLAIVIFLAVLLGLMAAQASGPASPAHIKAPVRHTPPPYATVPAPQRVHVHLKLGLRAGLLFNVRTGQVLWSRHPHMRVPIASLTKMMTALLVVSHVRPSDRAFITRKVVHFSGSGMGILPLHKHVLVKTLLYGLLLPSGNDAAIALAQRVAGSVDNFIKMMNARARAMKLSCTHFTTVSGVIDRGNYSCTRDLAVLAHAVLKQPLLARIVASEHAVQPLPIKHGKAWMNNNNPLLIEGYRGADGVKTGWTHAAGQCLVGTARRGHTWLGVVLLHSANTALQGPRVLSAGFAAVAPRKPARKSHSKPTRNRPKH